ncbi:MAG: response regulator [Bacteroidales bacterium]|nr:response regulator [Bacteroidales bacterium]
MKTLVVDDNADNRELIKEILSLRSINCFEAKSGLDAIKLAIQHDFRIIFMDVQMPLINGLNTTNVLRNKILPKNSQTKIIAVTAYTEYKNDSISSWFDEIIPKPIEIERINACISNELLRISNQK